MIDVFTYSFNNPKYLIYQNKCLKKFIKEQVAFTCIDNAIDQKISTELKKVCLDNSIRYSKNDKPDHSLHGASHYSALQYSYNKFIKNNKGLCLILDHDMFPIKNISLVDLLDESNIAGAPQSKEHIHYLHPSFILLNIDSMPSKESIDFNGACIDGINVDIGGNLFNYFKSNPSVKVKKLKSYLVKKDSEVIPSNSKDIYDEDCPFELVEDSLLHTRLGSNWLYMKDNIFQKRNDMIYNILDSYLNA